MSVRAPVSLARLSHRHPHLRSILGGMASFPVLCSSLAAHASRIMGFFFDKGRSNGAGLFRSPRRVRPAQRRRSGLDDAQGRHRQSTVSEQPRFRVMRLDQFSDLVRLEPAWQLLAARAIEPNVFYEPWMLLPALLQFHASARLEVYVVYADFSGYSRLVALVPFERRRRRFGLLSRARQLFRYYYCGLCTPLLDAEFGGQAMVELFRVLQAKGGKHAFDLVHADGPAMRLIQEARAANGAEPAIQTVARALLQPHADADAYMDAVFKKRKQRNLQKREQQLSEHGELCYDSLSEDGPVEAWLEDFLKLEASGWKGRAGTAFAVLPGHADFFRAICLHAHARGRLEMHALRLNGKSIAYLCLFVAGGELYAFRTAYDECFSRYAPGVLLAVWHSRAIHQRPEVRLVDSCADPESKLDNEIWSGRRQLALFEIDGVGAERKFRFGAAATSLESSDPFAGEARQPPAVTDCQDAKQEPGGKGDQRGNAGVDLQPEQADVQYTGKQGDRSV